MKKVIVLAGVSGVGKTHKRTNDPELSNLPYVDIADIYRDTPLFSWSEAYYALVSRVIDLLESHNTVVVEGYFIPGSVTRSMLMSDMSHVQTEFIDMHGSRQVCRERIASSGENVEKRLEVLERVWPNAQALYKRLNGRQINYEYAT